MGVPSLGKNNFWGPKLPQDTAGRVPGVTRAVGWQRRGCTSKPPCNTSEKMPQHWHQALLEGTGGTAGGLTRVTREGSPGINAIVLPPTC